LTTNYGEGNAVELAVTEVVVNAGTQVRQSILEDTVAEFADAMASGATFPPVVVFHDGNQHHLADGFHRVMAAQRIGRAVIEATVQPGTQQDALWFALGANRCNGNRLTKADKKHAILLALKTWPDKSARQIADQVGCSNIYVSRMREEAGVNKLTPESGRVTGKDGKSYPARKPKQNRDAEIAALAEKGYSADQVAAELGLAVGTVRNYASEGRVALRVEGTRRSRRFDANRFLINIVTNLEVLIDQEPLIECAAIDKESTEDWLRVLAEAKRAIGRLERKLKQAEGDSNDSSSN